MDLLKRPRRLRKNPFVRSLIRETRMSSDSLIYPIFIAEGTGIEQEIGAMPGQYRYSPDRLGFLLEKVLQSGVRSVLLFGIPQHKDAFGSQAYSDEGIIQKSLRQIKRDFPDLYVITDVCMCEYTSHGHCGILTDEGYTDNDATLEYLAKTALSHAEAGADMVAPSDMMDGRVLALRNALDAGDFTSVPIMSYAVKYSSSFYGPFRDAAGSAPSFGDRKSYQMDYHNSREAMKEALLDIDEGADIIMVKPALSYLDIIRSVSERISLPVAAYSVSGEYSMIKAGAALGYINEDDIVCETAVSIFRSGADILMSYYAMQIAGFIREGRIG